MITATFTKMVKMAVGAKLLSSINKPLGRSTKDLGRFAVKVMREGILTGGASIGTPFVRNAPATIARKGFGMPLVHTGQYLRSISYRIRGRGGRFVGFGGLRGKGWAFEVGPFGSRSQALARKHEYGEQRIPARPHIAPALNKIVARARGKYKAALKDIGNRIFIQVG